MQKNKAMAVFGRPLSCLLKLNNYQTTTMNKFCSCTLAGLLMVSPLFAQPLFTYGTKTVSQAEFIRAFEKNPEPGDRKKAMKEYLPLFINYKLKVQDALDKKMDTLPNQKDEFNSYRNQLAETFINDKSNVNLLMKEAFDRGQKDIKLGHLFIGFDPKDSAGQKRAEAAAQRARAEFLQKQDFAAVVNKYSTDENNKASAGVAGWITVFSVPYNYESAIYKTSVGGFTEIMKSASGYHIFKNMGERPASGRVKVAQIMLVNTDKSNPGNAVRIKNLADSLYNALKQGAAFDATALAFSNDRTSYNNGGLLPEFGVGQYSEKFESEAFALKQPGDISKPFETTYGWHILKLIEKHPVATTIEQADENGQLQQQVVASGRTKTAKDIYIQSQIPRLGYKKMPVPEKEIWKYTDSSMMGADTKLYTVKAATPLFSFGKKNITAGEWLQFVKTERMMPGAGATRSYTDMMKEFTTREAEKQLTSNLEKTDPDFARQLKEFKEANLLFEAMDKNVWSKAAADSVVLAKYYEQHKAKYQWAPSATAVLVTSTDSATTAQARTFVQQHLHNWHELSEKFPVNLIADSGRYELTQIPMATSEPIRKGMVTTPVKNDMDGSQTFAGIFDVLPAKEQRSFDEARGFVINDYQQVLEDKWIAALKKKYPVKVNEVNWQKLLATQK
jgi:peptidyl-prolyl cis-trans isomerase SurA